MQRISLQRPSALCMRTFNASFISRNRWSRRLTFRSLKHISNLWKDTSRTYALTIWWNAITSLKILRNSRSIMIWELSTVRPSLAQKRRIELRGWWSSRILNNLHTFKETLSASWLLKWALAQGRPNIKLSPRLTRFTNRGTRTKLTFTKSRTETKSAVLRERWSLQRWRSLTTTSRWTNRCLTFSTRDKTVWNKSSQNSKTSKSQASTWTNSQTSTNLLNTQTWTSLTGISKKSRKTYMAATNLPWMTDGIKPPKTSGVKSSLKITTRSRPFRNHKLLSRTQTYLPLVTKINL